MQTKIEKRNESAQRSGQRFVRVTKTLLQRVEFFTWVVDSIDWSIPKGSENAFLLLQLCPKKMTSSCQIRASIARNQYENMFARYT